MEFEITLLYQCYSSGIPMKISVTLPLDLFHCYSNCLFVFFIKLPLKVHSYCFKKVYGIFIIIMIYEITMVSIQVHQSKLYSHMYDILVQ